jgi:tetratricopeptide (TPR) repeat protein
MSETSNNASEKKIDPASNPIPVSKEPVTKLQPNPDPDSNQVMDPVSLTPPPAVDANSPASTPTPSPAVQPQASATPAASAPQATATDPLAKLAGGEQAKVTKRQSDEKDDDADFVGKEHKYLRTEVRPHAFVVMPFGKKKGINDQPFDFNAIYKQLIKPAIEAAGFEPFRADEETSSGDILTDMFQELLLADMVVCDLSIDNANAFYELGIRHALRKRGVVHIQAGRAYMPFDIFNVRTLPYHITPEGLPDPEHIRNDIKAIARLIRDTGASDRDMVHSPIYNLLTGLNEPNRKDLQTHLATGFWREYEEWKDKVTVAQRDKHIGDILLLTEEIKNPLLREEAITNVGNALAKLGRNELALKQYREGIEVNPTNIEFRREEAFHLNRVGRVNEAIVKLEGILNDYPNDTKSISYLGRIYKEMWTSSWDKIPEKNKRLKQAFNTYHWLIQSIDIYLKGFQVDLREYYPGINALTLSMLAVHLADRFDSKKTPDPDITRIRNLIPGLRDTLRFTLEGRISLEQEKTDYWTLASLAELRLLTSNDLAEVVRTYRKAVAALRRDVFSLRSSLQQLETIYSLGVRAEYVSACIELVKEEIRHASTGDAAAAEVTTTRNGRTKASGARGLVFTGYMIDFPGKDKKAFPIEREAEIRQEIRKRVEKFKAHSQDRAFLAGLSAGSEIIFAEVCAEAGIKVKAFLPYTESTYIRRFVAPGGEAWVDRFYKLRNSSYIDEIYQSEHLGQPKDGDNLFERNGRWAIYSALGRVGIENVRMIAVANEFVGDTKDRDVLLTSYMIDMMRNVGGVVEEFINPSKYIHNMIDSALEQLIQGNTEPIEKKKLLSRAIKKGKVDKKVK